MVPQKSFFFCVVPLDTVFDLKNKKVRKQKQTTMIQLNNIIILLLLSSSQMVLAVDIMGNPTQYPSVSVDGISYFIRTSTG